MNLAEPTDDGDLATKQYVDQVAQISIGIANNTIITSSLTANSSELTVGTVPLNMNSQRITNLGLATAGDHVINRNAGDARYYQSTTTLNSITAPSANLSLANNRVTTLATPTLTGDCATKGYIDTAYGNRLTDRITNTTNTDSNLVAGSSELLIGAVPLNMNS